MYKLSEGNVLVLAQQLRETPASTDAALEATARLLADTIAVFRDSDVPAGTEQRLLESLIDGPGGGLRTRAKIVKVAGQMQAIHRRSDQAGVAAGCPMPWRDSATTATARAERALECRGDGSGAR